MAAPLQLTTRQGDRIAIVRGLRTPFAKQATEFHGISALELGKLVVNELLIRSELSPKLIDQLVLVKLYKCRKRQTLPVKSFWVQV